MAENITYLIGAGASYHCLPLIKTMNSRMKAFSTFLKVQKESGALRHEFAQQFIDDLDELIGIELNRTSIDAYAKELYLSNEGEGSIKLVRLKILLSSYLIFEQLIKPNNLVLYSEKSDHSSFPSCRLKLDTDLQNLIRINIDKRYTTFWGEYLSLQNRTLPDNIKILSWNYDMQFEASYSSIIHGNLEMAQAVLQVYPSPQNEIINTKRSCILKLNGTAGLYEADHKKGYFNLFDLRKHELMENLSFLVEPYSKNYNRIFNKPLFAFAWENNGITSKTRAYAKEVAKETTILTIIGYSFPNFNRGIDKELFSEMPNLKKVYFQTMISEFEELLEKLDGINPRLRPMTRLVPNLTTFHVPIEV